MKFSNTVSKPLKLVEMLFLYLRMIWYHDVLISLSLVNELSGTIRLEETLTRAEALFRRFQRLVETIDKRNNFPAPTIRQRKSVTDKDSPSPEPSSSSTAPPTGASSSIDTGNPIRENEQNPVRANKPDKSTGNLDQKQPRKIISPELRKLLSRSVEKLDKEARVK